MALLFIGFVLGIVTAMMWGKDTSLLRRTVGMMKESLIDIIEESESEVEERRMMRDGRLKKRSAQMQALLDAKKKADCGCKEKEKAA